MSESPQRPRMTRRQLREMERAREQDAAQTESAEESSAPAEPDFDAAAPPTRPTMTRRQLREAAQREAAEREQEEQPIEVEPAAPPVSSVEAPVQAENQSALDALRAVAMQRAEERKQEAEAAQAPELPTRKPISERGDFSSQPLAAPPIPKPQRSEYSIPEPQIPEPKIPEVQAPDVEATKAAADNFADAPNVRPPAGISAIRTVEETGELSPILHTSPGENKWPTLAAPGEEAPQIKEPDDPLVTTGKQIPFRAPAWGARTLAAEEAAAARTVDEADEPQTINPTGQQPETSDRADTGSGMRAVETRWPAASGFGSVPPSGGSTFTGSPSSRFPTSTSYSAEFDDEDEDEEYEPMFTWLRILVLLIIAFTLGVLVWLIIGKDDMNSAAGAFGVDAGVVSSLGE